jgi:hypothetical protein
VTHDITPAGAELLSEIKDIQRLARGRSVRQRARLNRAFGKASWRKMMGVGLVRFASGEIRWAELQWFEAHGIGRKEIKVKRPL